METERGIIQSVIFGDRNGIQRRINNGMNGKKKYSWALVRTRWSPMDLTTDRYVRDISEEHMVPFAPLSVTTPC